MRRLGRQLLFEWERGLRSNEMTSANDFDYVVLINKLAIHLPCLKGRPLMWNCVNRETGFLGKTLQRRFTRVDKQLTSTSERCTYILRDSSHDGRS